MAYQVFQRTDERVDSPAVSIAALGRIGLNAAATRLFFKAGTRSVLLLWDVDAKRIALRAAPKGAKNSFALSKLGAASAAVRAKGFVDHIGWKASTRTMLPGKWTEAERLLEIDVPARYLKAANEEKSRA